MKRISLSLLLMAVFNLSTLISTAQTAFETIAEVKKVNHPVYKIELNFPPDVVEAALKKNFRSLVDEKGDESKNIRLYRGVVLPQVSNEQMDYYTSVERKSRRDKNVSNVFLWVANGDKFISASDNATIATNALSFLNGFMGTAADFNHNLQLKELEEAVDKAEKKVKSTTGDIADYEKKIQEFQKKLDDARKDLAERQAELDIQRQRLAQLKATLP